MTGFELDDEGVEMQEPDEPVNLEDDLESRLDQAVRLKWATGFSKSPAPKVDGPVVNRKLPFVLSSYGFIHFAVIINMVEGKCCILILARHLMGS